jgi:hypothetical protein
MNLQELIAALEVDDLALHIMLPDDTFVPPHFHITEVGKIHKEFIDCGGTRREQTTCLLQAWVASDEDHRLKSKKLSKILKMALPFLGTSDLPVEIEYEANCISQYPLAGLEFTPNGILLLTSSKHTDCLAKDKCGVSGCC